MIRIVCYLIPDSSMPNARVGWFTDWESPPHLSSSSALKRAATRMKTWEDRLKRGTYNGVTRVALEATGDITGTDEDGTAAVRVLEQLKAGTP